MKKKQTHKQSKYIVEFQKCVIWTKYVNRADKCSETVNILSFFFFLRDKITYTQVNRTCAEWNGLKCENYVNQYIYRNIQVKQHNTHDRKYALANTRHIVSDSTRFLQFCVYIWFFFYFFFIFLLCVVWSHSNEHRLNTNKKKLWAHCWRREEKKKRMHRNVISFNISFHLTLSLSWFYVCALQTPFNGRLTQRAHSINHNKMLKCRSFYDYCIFV